MTKQRVAVPIVDMSSLKGGALEGWLAHKLHIWAPATALLWGLLGNQLIVLVKGPAHYSQQRALFHYLSKHVHTHTRLTHTGVTHVTHNSQCTVQKITQTHTHALTQTSVKQTHTPKRHIRVRHTSHTHTSHTHTHTCTYASTHTCMDLCAYMQERMHMGTHRSKIFFSDDHVDSHDCYSTGLLLLLLLLII